MNLDHISSLVLIVGLSGAGKSAALDLFADRGFYRIENIPAALIEQVIDFAKAQAADKMRRTVLLPELDSEKCAEELREVLKKISPNNHQVRLVFLDASTDSIVKRYSETRRPHPSFDARRDGSLEDTIKHERALLAEFRERAHLVIDSSDLTPHDLRRELSGFIKNFESLPLRNVRVNFVSFGFKNGLPRDCDLIVDVRFLRNPHFVPELRPKSGLATDVAKFVLETAEAQTFLAKYSDLLNFLIPSYINEGKAYLNVGVGCTGGRHRSVAIAEALSRAIQPGDFLVSVKHRDVS